MTTFLWMDGADHYSITPGADISTLMKQGSYADAAGVKLSTDSRTGTYAFSVSGALGNFSRTFFPIVAGSSPAKVGLMLSHNVQSLPSVYNTQFAVAQFRNGFNKVIATLQLTPAGKVVIKSYNGTTLATSTRGVAAGSHNHYEVIMDITVGIKVRVNGNDAFIVEYTGALQSLNGSDTLTSNAVELVDFASVSNSQTPGNSGVAVWDDIVAYEPASYADAWIGMYGVYYLKPNADGHYTSWINSSGSSGYALINTVAPDDDTSFVYTQTLAAKSSYTVEPLPTNITDVAAVSPISYSRKTDAGPGSIQIGVRSGTTDAYNGDDLPQTTDYAWYDPIFKLDPATAAAWNPLNLPEIIVERTV